MRRTLAEHIDLQKMNFVNKNLDRPVVPCNNCGTINWGAKNELYCTLCERDWYSAWNQTVAQHPHLLQSMVDYILKEYGK